MLSFCRSFLRMVRTAWNISRAVLFVVLLLISSIHLVLQILTVFLPLALLCPRWYSFLNSHIGALWHWYTVTLCEHLLGVKIVVTGTPPSNRKPVLILMNHRTRLDWIFYFCCHARYASLSNLRVCLKEVLKHVPPAGWGIQILSFIFVKRRWENDEHVLNRCIHYYFQVGLQPHILLFPEGTDLNRGSREKSDIFAMKNNYPKYNYLLHPRTKGFTFMMEKMNQYSDETEIADVTVAYPYDVCQGETDLFHGNIPQEVHFHVETIPARSIPTNREHLETWCHGLWRKKERRLAQFYRQKRFPKDATTPLGSRWILVIKKVLAIVLWPIYIVVCTILLIYSSLVQVYYLTGVALYVLTYITFSGFDMLVQYLQIYNKRVLCPSYKPDKLTR